VALITLHSNWCLLGPNLDAGATADQRRPIGGLLVGDASATLAPFADERGLDHRHGTAGVLAEEPVSHTTVCRTDARGIRDSVDVGAVGQNQRNPTGNEKSP